MHLNYQNSVGSMLKTLQIHTYVYYLKNIACAVSQCIKDHDEDKVHSN